jgi:hypothetical protein
LSQVTSAINYDSSSETLRATVFTQTDPTPLGAGTAFESPYVYGRNGPLVFTDPSGKRSQERSIEGNAIADAVPNELALSLPAIPSCTGFQKVTVGGIFGCKVVRDERGKGLDFSFRVNPILVEAMRAERSDVTIDRVQYKVFRVTGPNRDQFSEYKSLRNSKKGSDVQSALDPLDYEFHTIARFSILKLRPSDAVAFQVDAKFKNSPKVVSLPVAGVPDAYELTVGGVRDRIKVRPS